MDRFKAPTESRYQPDRNNPLDRDVVQPCDFCGDRRAVLHAPKKVKAAVWCRVCSSEVVSDFKLDEEDISYI